MRRVSLAVTVLGDSVVEISLTRRGNRTLLNLKHTALRDRVPRAATARTAGAVLARSCISAPILTGRREPAVGQLPLPKPAFNRSGR